MDSHVLEWLWPIAACGGLGAFIDFLIGKSGQEKTREFLLRWWVRFDDVRWHNFGREEALFAAGLIDRWFGRRIYSFKRLYMTIAVILFFAACGYLKQSVHSSSWTPICDLCHLIMGIGFTIGTVVIFCVGFSMSISFTRFVTFQASRLCGSNTALNVIVFTMVMAINYILLVYWLRLMNTAKDYLLYFVFMFNNPSIISLSIIKISLFHLSHDLFNSFKSSPYPLEFIDLLYGRMGSFIDVFALYAANYLPSLLRFMISLLFVGSFLFRPLVMRPLSLIWARIVESEKPVFSLIFGGAAAFATAITEAAKRM
jgi:hypothetical protein